MKGTYAKSVCEVKKNLVNRTVWVSAAAVIIVIVIAASTYYYFAYIWSNPNPSPSVSPTTTPTSSATSPVSTDLNWGGYGVASDFNNPQPVVTGVSGSWVVPEVAVSQNDTFSAIWVGIGGLFGKTLIQTGTEQDCINGAVSYYAWYELLPSDSVTITTMNVSPGDKISASITLSDPTLDLWTISINDLSNGQSFNQDFIYAAGRLSAEWVVERPTVDNVLSHLADFGVVTFSHCSAEVNNKSENLGDLHSVELLLSNRHRNQLVEVSNISSDGSSFTVKYLVSQ